MSTLLRSPSFINALYQKAESLGIEELSSSDICLIEAGISLNKWLKNNYHGDMEYMQYHGEKRYHPEKLIPETESIITCQLNYFNSNLSPLKILQDSKKAYIAHYALGRDYHKVLRNALNKLGKWMTTQIKGLKYRAFVDSAPVLERAVNEKSGLGFFGKNTMIIHPDRGSFFFLGVIYLNKKIDLKKTHIKNHCGKCTRCINICPTQAIIAPFMVDARRCISYLTIEHFGTIPHTFRKAMGNRIFGCDDCQLVCPWNRFAKQHTIEDFLPKHNLHNITLLELFSWNEASFLKKMEGSPIRRLGYDKWIRNIAIAIGNDTPKKENIKALEDKQLTIDNEIIKEHIVWAINEQNQ